MIDYNKKIKNLNGYIRVLLNSNVKTHQDKERIHAKIQSVKKEIAQLKIEQQEAKKEKERLKKERYYERRRNKPRPDKRKKSNILKELRHELNKRIDLDYT